MEPNNNVPDAIDANLFPHLSVLSSAPTLSQPSFKVTMPDIESDLSSVPRILNVTSSSSCHLGALTQFAESVPAVTAANLSLPAQKSNKNMRHSSSETFGFHGVELTATRIEVSSGADRLFCI